MKKNLIYKVFWLELFEFKIFFNLVLSESSSSFLSSYAILAFYPLKTPKVVPEMPSFK